MNGGLLEPNEQVLLISARSKDVQVHKDGRGRVVIAISNFDEGIEVVHEGDKLWWPV